jgi:hypothetical protein
LGARAQIQDSWFLHDQHGISDRKSTRGPIHASAVTESASRRSRQSHELEPCSVEYHHAQYLEFGILVGLLWHCSSIFLVQKPFKQVLICLISGKGTQKLYLKRRFFLGKDPSQGQIPVRYIVIRLYSNFQLSRCRNWPKTVANIPSENGRV